MLKLGDHPHIVRVLDSGEDGGVPFIVSEYVGGGDLQGVLDDCAGRQLELERAIEIAVDLCRALEHAHGRGIIHRDLKPANVWLGDDGAARLGDFGLADRPQLARRGRGDARRHGRLPASRAGAGPELRRPRGPLLARRAALRAAHRRAAVSGRGRGGDHRPPPERQARGAVAAPARDPDRPRPRGPRPAVEIARRPAAERRRGAARDRRAAPPADDEPATAENPLEALARGVFVGRDHELEEMRGVLEDALGGRRPAGAAVGRPGDRQDAHRRAARHLRPRPRRPRVLGPLPRGRGPAAVLALVGGAARATCSTPIRWGCAGSSAAGPPTSPGSCRSWPSVSATSATRPTWRASRRASASSTRSPASSPAPRAPGRWCSCSTTCTGPTSRRCCSCASSPAGSPTPGCC